MGTSTRPVYSGLLPAEPVVGRVTVLDEGRVTVFDAVGRFTVFDVVGRVTVLDEGRVTVFDAVGRFTVFDVVGRDTVLDEGRFTVFDVVGRLPVFDTVGRLTVPLFSAFCAATRASCSRFVSSAMIGKC